MEAKVDQVSYDADEVERKRIEVQELFGRWLLLIDPQVVRLSEELDRLINAAMRELRP